MPGAIQIPALQSHHAIIEQFVNRKNDTMFSEIFQIKTEKNEKIKVE